MPSRCFGLTCPDDPLDLPTAPPRMGTLQALCQLAALAVRCLLHLAWRSPLQRPQPLLLWGPPCRKNRISSSFLS